MMSIKSAKTRFWILLCLQLFQICNMSVGQDEKPSLTAPVVPVQYIPGTSIQTGIWLTIEISTIGRLTWRNATSSDGNYYLQIVYENGARDYQPGRKHWIDAQWMIVSSERPNRYMLINRAQPNGVITYAGEDQPGQLFVVLIPEKNVGPDYEAGGQFRDDILWRFEPVTRNTNASRFYTVYNNRFTNNGILTWSYASDKDGTYYVVVYANGSAQDYKQQADWHWQFTPATDAVVDPSFDPGSKSETGGSSGLTSIIAICITVVIVVTLLVIGGVILSKIYFSRSAQLTYEEISAFLNGNGRSADGDASLAPDEMPYDTTFEIMENQLTIDQDSVLGSGAFGIVFRGTYQQEQIAVKTLKKGAEKEYLISLLSELKVMIYLGQHPNLVTLIGAFTEQLRQGILHVVVELCSGGCLLDYLRKQSGQGIFKSDDGAQRASYSNCRADSQYMNTPENNFRELPIPTTQLLQWAREICTAMEYLESKHVIHADLAARNILLTPDLQVKLSDFGLSRKLYEYASYTKRKQEPLPWRWMAIESLSQMEFSHKSDVWAFGVTLWEMYSFGDTPYPGMSYTMEFCNQLAQGLRLIPPRLAPEKVFNVMQNCWTKDPKKRPNFSEIKICLTKERGWAEQVNQM